MVVRPRNDIVEIFGYAPDDLSLAARNAWNSRHCVFVNAPCSKTNHDGSEVYGTCSVTSLGRDCIICPNRLYAGNYQILADVALDAFGPGYQVYSYSDYTKLRQQGVVETCIVALGQKPGKEVKLGRQLSMDWVLAKVRGRTLLEYVGVEVQSIDITGNYRENWAAYRDLPYGPNAYIPASGHGMNWANVHKRLIPQLIRKGLIYSRSSHVASGLYFLLPEIVYERFERIIGDDIPLINEKSPDNLTVFTYGLGPEVPKGFVRSLVPVRRLRFSLEEFSSRFVAGENLPGGEELDAAVRRGLI
ncbi:NotI family restriction endonuclease [Pseudomonas aeruginosa]|uniref:NotI family restriction endonuclease n=1 Tax=Pseudomonas aeruginosa TaxID=287 RepID=UPI00148B5AF5|nr:NotI family restriction endonuclease [Pseudomonas aeruginosa]